MDIQINQEKLMAVSEVLPQLDIPFRDFVYESAPRINPEDDTIPLFFAFAINQMCGTGNKKDGEVGCTAVWDRYFTIWSLNKNWFLPKIAAHLSFPDFCDLMDFSDIGKTISEKDLWLRWTLHGNLAISLLSQEDLVWSPELLRNLDPLIYDPVGKKLNLLWMALASRPERFIDDDGYGPVVDYHVMRLLMRLGVLENCDGVFQDLEFRKQSYLAIMEIHRLTGIDINRLDHWAWGMGKFVCRRHEKGCGKCIVDQACAKLDLCEPRADTIHY